MWEPVSALTATKDPSIVATIARGTSLRPPPAFRMALGALGCSSPPVSSPPACPKASKKAWRTHTLKTHSDAAHLLPRAHGAPRIAGPPLPAAPGGDVSRWAARERRRARLKPSPASESNTGHEP